MREGICQPSLCIDIQQHPYLFFGVSTSSSSKGDKRLASLAFDTDILDDDQGLGVGSLDRNE